MEKNFNLIAGTAAVWYPAITLGIKAGILALANVLPNECSEIPKSFDSGNGFTARNLYLKLFSINDAVTTTFGIAGLKYAADLLGYKGGYVRKPLLSLKEDEKAKIKAILLTAKFI